MDELIEKETALTIREIFESLGEKYFREWETRILEELISQENAIISTGAGVVINPYHRELIRLNSFVVYLHVDLDIQLARLSNDTVRPLLDGENKSKILQDLHRVRSPLYEQIANLSLDTSAKTVESIVQYLLHQGSTNVNNIE